MTNFAKCVRAVAAVGLVTAFAQAQAGIIRISEGAFTAAAGLITFSEFAMGTVNPHYAPADYGGGGGLPSVDFDGYFLGQSVSATPGIDCPGAAPSGCIVGTPSGPLSLDAAAPNTFIASDPSTPTTPTLSGSPLYNGSIAILFDTDVAGVGLSAGFFNAAGGTAIKAYDRTGALLGSVVNTGTGIEFLGLVTDDGLAHIAGLGFSLVGDEPFGYVIDNLRFGLPGQINVPEPGTLALFGLGALGFMRARRRKSI